MTAQGVYADGRTYELPSGWDPIEAPTLETAHGRALAALGYSSHDAFGAGVGRVRAYYEPEGGYAGNLFTTAQPNHEGYIGAADLYAVSTLSMRFPPLTGRRLLGASPKGTNVTRQLERLDPDLPITDLTAEVLDAMWDLQDCLRSVMSTEVKRSNWWVFGAKMCARKRPRLFPVRDSLVCGYLTDWKPLGGKEGQLGWFSRDIQVFAYLMTSKRVTSALSELRTELSTTPVGDELDSSDMRLLDVALWTAAKDEATAQGQPVMPDENDLDSTSHSFG